jgi:triphosphoribosyl-dephospho-CoA synthase
MARAASDDRRADALASLAVSVLVDEATLAPKPGLVDARGSGAHRDLTLDLMLVSAHALRPAFVEMARAGLAAKRHGMVLREQLGSIGRDAEAAMMRATGGVNTHRGAIWALGLLVGAAGLRTEASRHSQTLAGAPVARVANADGNDSGFAASVARDAGAIARLPDRFAPAHTSNKGERACRAYGVQGARGQAQAAFPHVLRDGLPELRRSRERGDNETQARVNALLAIMRRLDDTCVLARGGRRALAFTQSGACRVLAAGGIATLAGRHALHRLETGLLALDASPGGAADLLAATLFLDRLAQLPRPSFRILHGDM